MSETSSEVHFDNEKESIDSYSSQAEPGIDKESKNSKNREHGKRSSSISKSDARSISSDDRSEHLERLLRETHQSVSNRDVFIAMLQKQLKKIEDLYKKTLDQQQDLRQKYANVVLELSQLKIICEKLKDENDTLSQTNNENVKRCQREREALQAEVDNWKKEYDQLLKAIDNMENNTKTMKTILSAETADRSDHNLDCGNMKMLMEQYTQIQEALNAQNAKLDQFLGRFRVIGDGGCHIVTNLEGIKCINKTLSENIGSIISEVPGQKKIDVNEEIPPSPPAKRECCIMPPQPQEEQEGTCPVSSAYESSEEPLTLTTIDEVSHSGSCSEDTPKSVTPPPPSLNQASQTDLSQDGCEEDIGESNEILSTNDKYIQTDAISGELYGFVPMISKQVQTEVEDLSGCDQQCITDCSIETCDASEMLKAIQTNSICCLSTAVDAPLLKCPALISSSISEKAISEVETQTESILDSIYSTKVPCTPPGSRSEYFECIRSTTEESTQTDSICSAEGKAPLSNNACCILEAIRRLHRDQFTQTELMDDGSSTNTQDLVAPHPSLQDATSPGPTHATTQTEEVAVYSEVDVTSTIENIPQKTKVNTSAEVLSNPSDEHILVTELPVVKVLPIKLAQEPIVITFVSQNTQTPAIQTDEDQAETVSAISNDQPHEKVEEPLEVRSLLKDEFAEALHDSKPHPTPKRCGTIGWIPPEAKDEYSETEPLWEYQLFPEMPGMEVPIDQALQTDAKPVQPECCIQLPELAEASTQTGDIIHKDNYASTSDIAIGCCKRKKVTRKKDKEPEVKIYEDACICTSDDDLSPYYAPYAPYKQKVVSYDTTIMAKPETDEKHTSMDVQESGGGDLASENKELRQQLEDRNKEIEELKRIRSFLCLRSKYTSETNYSEDNNVENLLKEKQQLLDENNALKQVINRLQDDVKRLEKELENAGKRIVLSESGKEKCLSETNCIIKEFEANVQDLSQRYANALIEIETLKEEKSTLTVQIDMLNETVKQYKEQATLCKLETEKMTEKASVLENTIKDLEEQHDVHSINSEEVEDMKTTLHELQTRYDLLKEEHDKLVEDNKEVFLLKKKTSNLIWELDTKDVMINDFREHITDLEKELVAMREEMLHSSENAKHEMDILIETCNELERKLETTKEILVKESNLIDHEVNTSSSNINQNQELETQLAEKTEEIEKLTHELEEVKSNFDGEYHKLQAKYELLEVRLEREQEEHQRDLDILDEKLKQYVDAETTTIGSSDGESSTTDSGLTTQLQDCLSKNRQYKDEVQNLTEQLKRLQNIGKDYGLVKAENMKLKSQVQTLQKQLDDLKDVETKLKKLRQERDELSVKVQYLENKFSNLRCKCGVEVENRGKPLCVVPAKRDSSPGQPCKASTSRICENKKYTISTNVTVLCDKSGKSTSTDACPGRPREPVNCAHTTTLQMRLLSINRMEKQVDQMIMSVRRQNQRMNDSVHSRAQSDKEIDARINQLKQRREKIMSNLNCFKKELTGKKYIQIILCPNFDTWERGSNRRLCSRA
ncbi:hypothetical protein MML48_7g00008838 [Holotrichia oblita]|uniref:Uncharacterized protein n=1 Tax=Holotrichia oblita TaxID=644536 RepID=A0ACB9SVL5_HOLOL|nr:hypothetical protein MML48_7g00008838 [Holotrichia oblita]